jgi:hypothetical protein
VCLADSSEASMLGTFDAEAWLVHPGGGATCGAISPAAQMVAIGKLDGSVALWSFADAWESGPIREVSLHDWGYGPEDTGPVTAIDWAPDGQACSTFFTAML